MGCAVGTAARSGGLHVLRDAIEPARGGGLRQHVGHVGARRALRICRHPRRGSRPRRARRRSGRPGAGSRRSGRRLRDARPPHAWPSGSGPSRPSGSDWSAPTELSMTKRSTPASRARSIRRLAPSRSTLSVISGPVDPPEPAAKTTACIPSQTPSCRSVRSPWRSVDALGERAGVGAFADERGRLVALSTSSWTRCRPVLPVAPATRMVMLMVVLRWIACACSERRAGSGAITAGRSPSR